MDGLDGFATAFRTRLAILECQTEIPIPHVFGDLVEAERVVKDVRGAVLATHVDILRFERDVTLRKLGAFITMTEVIVE
jgi:hypothetical protein